MQFAKEFKQLLDESPRMCVNSRNVGNCPYGDFIYNCKNCYLCFDNGGSQNCYYMTNSMKNKECADCDFTRWSELCYECMNIEKCYNCNFCVDLINCHDLERCFDCIGCNDCFGCIGLRHKNYYIYNQQFTKEEYAEKMKSIKFDSQEFRTLKLKTPHVNLHHSKSENCTGDYIYNSSGCAQCFDINNMENCIYYESGNYNSADKDCCDINEGSGSELCYDCFSIGYCYNSNFIIESSYCTNCEFGMGLEQCKDCFGCAYIKNKQYYILNKPYSKEEYFKKVSEIKEKLIQSGEYCLASIVEKNRKKAVI